MCKRTSRDPLMRAFLDRYHLHMLAVPRDSAAVGDLYIASNGTLSAPGNMQHLLEPAFTLPALRTAEPMADVAGQISRGIEARVGLELLQGFISVFAGPAIAGNIRGSYDAKRTQLIRFRFNHVERDSVDIFEFGSKLTGHRMLTTHPLFAADSRFYVVTAVARTSGISIIAEGERGQAIDVDVRALQELAVSSALKLGSSAASEISYSGHKPLAFGVELHELGYDRERYAFKLSVPTKPMLVRGTAPDESMAAAMIDSISPAFIGGLEGDVLLEVPG